MFGSIVGHLGTDPELREAEGGGYKYARLTVAQNKYNPETRERDITMWYSVFFPGRKGEVVAQNFKKGDPIILHGEMQKVYVNDKGNPSLDFRAYDFEFVPRNGGTSEMASAPVGEAMDTGMGGDPFA